MRIYPYVVMRFAPVLGSTSGRSIVRAVGWYPTLDQAVQAARSTPFYRGRTWVALRGALAHSPTAAARVNSQYPKGGPGRV